MNKKIIDKVRSIKSVLERTKNLLISYTSHPWFVSTRTTTKVCLSVRDDTNRGEGGLLEPEQAIGRGGIQYMQRFPSLLRSVAMLILFFTAFNTSAQNINIPNSAGPMGLEVNSYTGNLFFERTDFAIPGVELSLDITFSYNSFDYNINRGFGNGWSFNYNIYYKKIAADSLVVVWDDSREDTCVSAGNGNYQVPRGFFYNLKEYETGKFSITEKSGLQYLFENSTTKKLTKIATPNGNYITATYNGENLATLTNNFNQSVSFEFNPDGLLKTITDAIATPTRKWSYTYDSRGNLRTVTDPLGGRDAYTYIINGPMQTIKDKNQNVVDLVYYPNYALKEMVGCNKRVSYSYDERQLLSVVTDHIDGGENQVNKYYFSRTNDNFVQLKAISSNCCGYDVAIEYDEQGNKTQQTDANGNITRYTYDSIGNVLTATDALNQRTTFTYTSEYNLLKSVTDPNGNATTLDYDSKGNLTKLTDANGGIYTATYDAQGNMLSSTNPAGNTFSYAYDANGRPSSVTGPDGKSVSATVSPRGELQNLVDTKSGTTSVTYDILGRAVQLTDVLNNRINLSYDAIGNMTVLKDKSNETYNFSYDASNRVRELSYPLGAKMTFDYDGMDNVTGMVDAEGGNMKLQYDNRDLLKLMKDAEGNETTFSYDRKGNLITQNLPSGRILTYTYDALDQIKEIKDGDGILVSLVYDGNGNVTKYTDDLGGVYQYEYDRKDRVKKITDPVGNNVEITYTVNGEIKTVKDQNGKSATLTYNDYGETTSVSDQNGATTSIGYDSEGNIISLTDANGNVTAYTYDALSRPVRATFPDGKYTEYTYDINDRIVAFRNKDGNTIQFVYDALDRVISKTLPGGAIYTYTYDKTGRVKTATNSEGTVELAYDIMGRLVSEKSQGREVGYSYNVSGRTQSTVYPDSTVIMKTYNSRDQLITIQKNNQPVVTYEYNNAGQVTSQAYINGVTTYYTYDISGRLTGITANGIQNLAYTYDERSNVTSVIRGDTDQSEFFTYDNASRLLTYKRGKLGGPYSVNDSYTYDALGNRISASIGGKNITYTTNSLNQIVSMNDGTKTTNYTYDNNGNLTFDGKYTKTYDAEKRLIRDYASPTEDITYAYDVVGRRISKNINGTTTYYTYDGLNAIEERNGADDIINRTIFSRFLNPVVNEKDGVPYYYHQNHLLSTDKMTNGSGAVAEQYRYDVYGKQKIYDASGNELPGSVTGNRYGFTGQVYDSATGHNQFFFRSYNPETGLFDQQDLIGYGDGMGLYQYVGNNPANGIDVLGLAGDPCGGTQQSNVTTNVKSWTDNLTTVSGWLLSGKIMIEQNNFKNLFEAREALKTEGDFTKFFKNSSWASNFRNASSQVDMKNASIVKLEGASDFLGKFGLAAGVVDVGFKGYDAYNAYNSPNSTSLQKGEAYSDLAASGGNLGLGIATAIGGATAAPAVATAAAATATSLAVYGVADFATEKITGMSLREQQYRYVTDPAARWLVEKGINGSWTEYHQYKYLYENFGYERAELFKEIYNRKKTGMVINCPQGSGRGTQNNPPGPTIGTTGQTEIIQSRDPNEMIAPAGQPDKRWVSVNDRLPYTVLFENHIDASAPAKYIKITVPVDDKMDPSKFQLSEIGFNNLSFSVPQNVSANYQRLDARDSLGLFVDMTAGFDVMNNQFFWEFQSIDPVTMLPPDDPTKGFLLLQDTTTAGSRSGHGFVNFSVKPVSNAHTLDEIFAKADIVFDQNDTIPTNIEINTIDAVAPSSQLSPLAESYISEIPLSWSAQDDPGGSGVAYYTLYYSTDGVNFSILRDKMTRTDTILPAPGDQRYYFFVLATDSVGNAEQMDINMVKNTYLIENGRPQPLQWLYFKGMNKGHDNLLEWATANEQRTKEFIVERSFDARDFAAIGNVKAAGNTSGNTSYSFTDYNIDRLGKDVMYYRLIQTDLDGGESYSNVVRLNYEEAKLKKTIVYPNPTKGKVTVTTNDQNLIGTEAQVYDEAGKVLQVVKITSLNQQFDLSGYSGGIYFIRLVNKEVLRVMKH